MTEVSKEAVEALCLCVDESSSTTINTFEAKAVLENMAEEGFTIAPIAPVTDEKLREAVDLVKYYHSGNSVDCDELSDAMQTIYATLTELTELRAAMTWQPIDTAPKDGTKVLLGRFVLNCPEGKNGRMAVDFWHTVNPHGYEGWGKFNTRYWPATHWQPLPTPPKED